ncbi:hypothetical protein Tco_0950733 [Tanacetum coccineum]
MVAAMKHMASNFAKLDKFEGVDFKRWQKKMHFLLSSMSVVYVLTTPMLEDGGDNPTVEQVRKRAKWDNDDYVCRVLILNGMSDSLFDIYQNVETFKELWETLQAQLVDTDTELDLVEAPSEAEELHSLGSRVPFVSEEFEASKPSSTRTVSSHSSVSSDSTAPLSPDHPFTHDSPTPTPT